MPAPLARGIIIAASVIVAAGIAAYENPQFREWFDRSREKIALAFQSTLDDIRPPRPKQNDPSMTEDQDEKAEERRRQARQEILDRGKKLEELRQRKRRKSKEDTLSKSIDEKSSPSFDTLVDSDGNLRDSSMPTGNSSAIEAQDQSGIRARHETHSQNMSGPISPAATDFSHLAEPIDEPWESQYEREMRNTWNIPLPSDRTPTASTHASESLIDLTPTTEDFPDPDFSVPGSDLGQTEYFSIPPRSFTAGRSIRSASVSGSESEYYYAHPSSPHQPQRARQLDPALHAHPGLGPASSAASVAGGSHVHLDSLTDDSPSEFGDGIRTPASAWTDVGSTISSSDAEEIR